MYTSEQQARRDASPLTKAMMAASMAQLIVIIASYCFVIYFLSTGKGYAGALITFWLNIVLLWLNTIIGMLWEKDMYGHYFMCREFFWEDAGNLAALIAYNSYFAALWLNWSQHDTALLMLVANSVYLVNFAQFVFKLMRGRKQRR
jgi:3-vinyl bacteriochlorophyllide hydratase